MGLIYIAQYILNEEYACDHCHEFPPDLDLMLPEEPYTILFDSFALIRERWGAPINISSGYRCPVHNAFSGGRPLSAHQWGLALDLDVETHQVEPLSRIIDEVAPDVRMFKYEGFIHIDVAWAIKPRASDAWEKGWRG